MWGKVLESVRESYFGVYLNVVYYVDFKDFYFWCMVVEFIWYIGGYGCMSWVFFDEWKNVFFDLIFNYE